MQMVVEALELQQERPAAAQLVIGPPAHRCLARPARTPPRWTRRLRRRRARRSASASSGVRPCASRSRPRCLWNSRASTCRMRSPTTWKRKWPDSITPAWTGPTATWWTSGPVTGTVHAAGSSGWSTSGRKGSCPAKRAPYRSCASRSSQSAAGATSTTDSKPSAVAQPSTSVSCEPRSATRSEDGSSSPRAHSPAKRRPARSCRATLLTPGAGLDDLARVTRCPA